jgi:GR25 family glycosyltransferase involved in LPS biosynthesis
LKGYVITITALKESVDISNRLIESGKKFGFPDIEIFDAITPKDKPKELFKQETLNPSEFLSNTYSRLQPLMCCFLSHYFLWKKCIELNEPIAIFEHDAVFIRKFDSKEIQNHLDTKHGVISIGAPSFGNFKTPSKNGIVKLMSKQYMPGAHALIVHPIAASKLIKYAQTYSPEPTDVFLHNKRFDFLYEQYPYPVEVQESFSTVQIEKGCRAKFAYRINKDNYRIIEV